MSKPDSAACYDQASLREINIRRRNILPRPDNPEEQRWAVEGEADVKNLETVRRGR